MAPFRVLLLDIHEPEQLVWARDLATPLGLTLEAPMTPDARELNNLLAAANGLVVHHRPVTAEVIAAAPHLRLIQKYGGRRDGIDVETARAQGITVALMPLPGAIAVAEHAMALVLACAKQIIPAHQATVSGAYRGLGIEPKLTSERSHGFQWMKIQGIEELSGLTLGIFGFGDIGNEVARRARAFGMRVFYHKRTPLPADLEKDLGVTYASKDELLRQADFLVLTSPLTPETENAIGERELSLMKPTAYLVNVSRGGVVDEPALAAALRAHRLAGAGLDVFVQEPIPFDHPFLTLDNVTLTPHIAGGKGGARQRQMLAVLANLARYARGEPCLHQIV